jgi:hypothetical protein
MECPIFYARGPYETKDYLTVGLQRQKRDWWYKYGCVRLLSGGGGCITPPPTWSFYPPASNSNSKIVYSDVYTGWNFETERWTFILPLVL